MGPRQQCRGRVVTVGRRKAQPGGAQVCQGEKHPKACKLLLSAFFFYSSCLGEKKKKKKQRFLWRRMQKGCRILTISCTGVFPSGVWAQAWHSGTTGGDWPERMRPLSGTHGEPGLLSIPPRSWAGGRTMRTRDQGAQGPPRAGVWWPTGHCHSRLSCRLHACLVGLSLGVERGAWALG